MKKRNEGEEGTEGVGRLRILQMFLLEKISLLIDQIISLVPSLNSEERQEEGGEEVRKKEKEERESKISEKKGETKRRKKREKEEEKQEEIANLRCDDECLEKVKIFLLIAFQVLFCFIIICCCFVAFCYCFLGINFFG